MENPKQITLQDGTKAGDLVLCDAGVFGALPYPCIVIACLESSPQGENGNVLIRELVSEAHGDVKTQWVLGVRVQKLTPELALELMSSYNQATQTLLQAMQVLMQPSEN